MSDLGEALRLALALIARFDQSLGTIVSLSLFVSTSAVLLASCIGLPLGTALAVYRFPGRDGVVIVMNALLGLPPVVAGLLVYVLLSRSGPLGSLGLLFTPGAMIVAQSVLTTPIITALIHRAMEDVWRDYGDALQSDGATRFRALPILLSIGRASIVTAFLAAFGRAISEVGAIIVVGGNIAGV